MLVDWSQNNAAKTTVAPYSLRARPEPTVSTPVTWDEVAGLPVGRRPAFTAADVLERVEQDGDLLADLVTMPSAKRPEAAAAPRSGRFNTAIQSYARSKLR